MEQNPYAKPLKTHQPSQTCTVHTAGSWAYGISPSDFVIMVHCHLVSSSQSAGWVLSAIDYWAAANISMRRDMPLPWQPPPSRLIHYVTLWYRSPIQTQQSRGVNAPPPALSVTFSSFAQFSFCRTSTLVRRMWHHENVIDHGKFWQIYYWLWSYLVQNLKGFCQHI